MCVIDFVIVIKSVLLPLGYHECAWTGRSALPLDSAVSFHPGLVLLNVTGIGILTSLSQNPDGAGRRSHDVF